MKRLVILGAGGYGQTVADVSHQLGYTTMVLDDADPDHTLSTFSSYIDEHTSFIPAFGNNSFRMEWINRIEENGGEFATLIHPTAYVSPTATISSGCVILPHAIINTDVVVGKGCIINLGAIVDHGCILEEGVHIAPGAIVKGENRIEKCSKIEAGEVVERGSRK
jgi:UDP-N-acetylbacillosamine N-acetyltransferase